MADNTTSWNLASNISGTGHGPSGRSPHQMNTKEIVKIVCFGVLAVLIVFANLLMIAAFHVNRRLRTRTNLLLMSLAIADMLIGTISMPLWMCTSITFTEKGPVYRVYLMFDIICGVSSILNMTAVSLERCYALRRPMKHRNIRKRIFIAAILVAWILAILAGTSTEFLRSTFYQRGVVLTAAFFFIPLAIILGTYGTIFFIARAHGRVRGASLFKKDLRIATTVAVVIGVFVICWTPFFASSFTVNVCKTKMWMTIGCQRFKKLLGEFEFIEILKWFQYGNSVCNPIIYGLRNEEFRRTFRKILLRLCCKKVRITEYNKNAHGGIPREPRALLQCEAGCECVHPRSVTPSSQPVQGGYTQVIQSDHPIKLEILAIESLADGIQKQNQGCAHDSFPFVFTSESNHLTRVLAVAAHSTELCNPAYEPDMTETGASNMTCMSHERYTEASTQQKTARVQLTDSKDQGNEQDNDEKSKLKPSLPY